MNNRFDIPGGIYAYLNVFGMGTGNQDVVYSHGSWQASLMINKSWKNWTFTLSANDLLGTWRQPFDTATNTVTYGKYKGKAARQDEIDRL